MKRWKHKKYKRDFLGSYETKRKKRKLIIEGYGDVDGKMTYLRFEFTSWRGAKKEGWSKL